jgi:hypothetical protein
MESVTVLSCAFNSIRVESISGTMACIHALVRRLEFSAFEILETILKGQRVNNKFIDAIVLEILRHHGPSPSRILTVFKKRRAFSKWSIILAAVFIKKAWAAFVARSLEPESKFVTNFLKKRWCAQISALNSGININGR